MAIDIEWQVKPPTKKGETNQPQLFPRIVNADVVGDAELADKIAAHSGLSRGVVTNVLEDLADVLATMMHEGKEVSLSSIGRFRLSIGTDADISPDTVNSTRKICVRGINFQPSDTLLNAIANPSFRQVARNASVVAPSTEQQHRVCQPFQSKTHHRYCATQRTDGYAGDKKRGEWKGYEISEKYISGLARDRNKKCYVACYFQI